MDIYVSEIGPAEAKELLAFNTRNRNLRTRYIAKLADDMRSGAWRDGGSILFAGTGENRVLIDGQHRLHAVVAADVKVNFVIVENLAIGDQQAVDTGIRRSLADVLKFQGEPNCTDLAATLGWYWRWSNGAMKSNYTPTVAQALDVFRDHPGLRDCFSPTRPAARQLGLSRGLCVQRNAIAREIAAAQALARNTATAAESTYNLSSASTTASGGRATTGGIISNLNADVGKIRRFAWAIRRLAREGLNKAYLSQLIALGPDQGGAIAGELAGAGLGDIRSINAAESAITHQSNQLGASAVSAMYAAGRESGAGFLAGLRDQKKAIESLMSQIAASLVAQLRRDLGIASPSRVMFSHGADTLQGYINGVKSKAGELQALMRTIGGGVAVGGVGGLAVGGGGGGGGGASHATINITAQFNPSTQGYSSPAFYQYLQREIQEAVARWSLNNPGTGFGLPGRA